MSSLTSPFAPLTTLAGMNRFSAWPARLAVASDLELYKIVQVGAEVGSGVSSKSRDLGFESRHQPFKWWCYIKVFTSTC